MRSLRSPAVYALAALGALAGSSLSKVARADEAACVAASENELSLRKQGKLRDAIKLLVTCAAPTCPDEVKNECGRRLVDLNAILPSLVLHATDAAGNDLPGVTVSLDGVALPDGLNGRPVQVDPGNHALHFELTGKPSVDKTVLVAEGERDRRVTVVMGEPAGAGPVTTPAPESNGPATMRLVGYGVGGAGAVGLVIGGVLGGLAFSKWSSAKGECNGGGSNPCAHNTNSAATNDQQTAGTFADASTGLLIAGGALAATGVVLVLLGRKATPTTGLHWSPTVLAHGGALGLSGAW